MAAASPIILNSSSPSSYQIPPITPPSLQNKSGILISSSPGLVSPSRFVKPRASGLKSGSRAQQVPDGVQVGFASASALWKVKELELEEKRTETKVWQDEREESRVKQPKESRGKLAKPKNAAHTLKVLESVPANGLDEYEDVDVDVSAPKTSKKAKSKLLSVTKDNGEVPNRTKKAARTAKAQQALPVKQNIEEYAYVDPEIPVPKKSKDKTVPGTSRNITADVSHTHETARTGTVSLSSYALNALPQPPALRDAIELNVSKQKKPRKRANKMEDAPTKAHAKKLGKRKMKSESIILNSDDPEPVDEPTMASNYFQPTRAQGTELERSHAELDTDRIPMELLKTELSEQRPPNVTRPTNCDRAKQQEAKNEHTFDLAPEPSSCFANAAVDDASKEKAISEEPPMEDNSPLIPLDGAHHTLAPLTIPSKRRDWTPVKDNVTPDTEQQRPLTADSGNSEPKRQLADILGSFSYVSEDVSLNAVARTATGEAVTKRVRIELGAPVMPGVVIRNEENAAIPSLPKPAKQKKGRKKAQTITALATAAFKPPNEQTTDEGTISHFFSPSKDCANEPAAKPEQPKAKSTKPRKPRKPKEKSTEEPRDSSRKQKKPAKAKQAKVKFNEADYRSKLYSPGRATAELSRQGFLFGTSSQLAVDEPASFIRDMQTAIQQSEFRVGSKVEGTLASSQTPFSQFQQSPQCKSCIRVPTAPHGTCLSIEQARRELWCVSARDSEGAIFKAGDTTVAVPCDVMAEEMMCHEIGYAEPMPVPMAEETEKNELSEPQMEPKPIVVDLCDTSPIAIPEAILAVGASIERHTLQEQAVEEASPPLPVQDTEDPDDWMLLESSSPLPAMQQRPASVKLCGNPSAPHSFGDLANLSPRRFRLPLSPLNPNVMVLNGWSPGKPITSGQVRPLSSSPADQARQRSPGGRGRGRPRKDAANDSLSPSPAKRRGRPPKLKTLASEPAQLSRPKKQTTVLSASQPMEREGWIDIDDIYDSDSPATPSPPRRRATSSPPAIQPLTLGPLIQAKAPAVAATTLKSNNTSWESIRTELYNRITTMVKSAPPSNDGCKPSWYEKILLYDPIVLEDITAWLNEQGLRVETRKQKPQAKKRGRKRKDAEPEADEVKWEVHEEPLQAWMVQKWCEDQSICCLWKEGLRGGVRTRY